MRHATVGTKGGRSRLENWFGTPACRDLGALSESLMLPPCAVYRGASTALGDGVWAAHRSDRRPSSAVLLVYRTIGSGKLVR